MQNKKIKVEAGQTLYDVVLQQTGTIEGLFEFLELNNSQLDPIHYSLGMHWWFSYYELGKELEVPETISKNTSILKEFDKKNIKIATFSNDYNNLFEV